MQHWYGSHYIEFGAGLGATAIAAVLNGAFVTIVDSNAQGGLLEN